MPTMTDKGPPGNKKEHTPNEDGNDVARKEMELNDVGTLQPTNSSLETQHVECESNNTAEDNTVVNKHSNKYKVKGKSRLRSHASKCDESVTAIKQEHVETSPADCQDRIRNTLGAQRGLLEGVEEFNSLDDNDKVDINDVVMTFQFDPVSSELKPSIDGGNNHSGTAAEEKAFLENAKQNRKKRVKCRICGMSYVSVANLRRHVSNMHSEELAFSEESFRLICVRDTSDTCEGQPSTQRSQSSVSEYSPSRGNKYRLFECNVCKSVYRRVGNIIHHFKHQHCPSSMIEGSLEDCYTTITVEDEEYRRYIRGTPARSLAAMQNTDARKERQGLEETTPLCSSDETKSVAVVEDNQMVQDEPEQLSPKCTDTSTAPETTQNHSPEIASPRIRQDTKEELTGILVNHNSLIKTTAMNTADGGSAADVPRGISMEFGDEAFDKDCVKEEKDDILDRGDVIDCNMTAENTQDFARMYMMTVMEEEEDGDEEEDELIWQKVGADSSGKTTPKYASNTTTSSLGGTEETAKTQENLEKTTRCYPRKVAKSSQPICKDIEELNDTTVPHNMFIRLVQFPLSKNKVKLADTTLIRAGAEKPECWKVVPSTVSSGDALAPIVVQHNGQENPTEEIQVTTEIIDIEPEVDESCITDRSGTDVVRNRKSNRVTKTKNDRGKIASMSPASYSPLEACRKVTKRQFDVQSSSEGPPPKYKFVPLPDGTTLTDGTDMNPVTDDNIQNTDALTETDILTPADDNHVTSADRNIVESRLKSAEKVNAVCGSAEPLLHSLEDIGRQCNDTNLMSGISTEEIFQIQQRLIDLLSTVMSVHKGRCLPSDQPDT